jgi:hypothetical protein
MRSRTHLRAVITCEAIVILFSSYAIAGTWTTLDFPGDNISDTQAFGISGSLIVGTYYNSTGMHSFLYDGQTWTTLNAPGAGTTLVQDNFGDSFVGSYYTSSGGKAAYSFLYDGTSWSTLSKSGAVNIRAYGIDGSNIVGSYDDSYGKHGFLYDGQTWTTIDKTGAAGTYLLGISGNDIVGQYTDVTGYSHPFMYNQGSWTDIPANPWTTAPTVTDISGNYIVSTFGALQTGGYGLLYNGISWTKLEMPGALGTFVYGVDGDKVVGSYMITGITGNKIHGFVYTIPEPASAILIGAGFFFARLRHRQS